MTRSCLGQSPPRSLRMSSPPTARHYLAASWRHPAHGQAAPPWQSQPATLAPCLRPLHQAGFCWLSRPQLMRLAQQQLAAMQQRPRPAKSVSVCCLVSALFSVLGIPDHQVHVAAGCGCWMSELSSVLDLPSLLLSFLKGFNTGRRRCLRLYLQKSAVPPCSLPGAGAGPSADRLPATSPAKAKTEPAVRRHTLPSFPQSSPGLRPQMHSAAFLCCRSHLPQPWRRRVALRQVPRPGSQASSFSSAASQLQSVLSSTLESSMEHGTPRSATRFFARLDNEVWPLFCGVSSTVLLLRQQAGCLPA